MGLRFSQRIGLSSIKTELEKTGMSEELRNSLWSSIKEFLIDQKNNYKSSYDGSYTALAAFYRGLWLHYFKLPIDTLAMYDDKSVVGETAAEFLRNYFFNANWSQVFDLIEFCADNNDFFQKHCNIILKSEMSAYRFIDGKLAEINSANEVQEINSAIQNSDRFKSVKTHLQTALSLLSDRKSPDFRNSIKESISAVEALCKIIVNDSNTTLGQALKQIEKKHEIPKSLKTAFSALYGYTSDEAGIRHSLLENDSIVLLEEARFMLIVCSAFVNYLINKL